MKQLDVGWGGKKLIMKYRCESLGGKVKSRSGSLEEEESEANARISLMGSHNDFAVASQRPFFRVASEKKNIKRIPRMSAHPKSLRFSADRKGIA